MGNQGLKTSVNIKVKDLPVLLPGGRGERMLFSPHPDACLLLGKGSAFSRDGWHRDEDADSAAAAPLPGKTRKGVWSITFFFSKFFCVLWGCSEIPSLSPRRLIDPRPG